jgi:hypothetical protein
LDALLELDVLVPEGVALKVKADEVGATLKQTVLLAYGSGWGESEEKGGDELACKNLDAESALDTRTILIVNCVVNSSRGRGGRANEASSRIVSSAPTKRERIPPYRKALAVC